MSSGLVLGLCFSPVSNCIASCVAFCRILCSVGNAAFSLSSGIQHGSGSDRSTLSVMADILHSSNGCCREH
eukprot:11670745-Prorocentrum_lima.AAC.1